MEREISCKPFKKHSMEQLKLVHSFDWIDFAQLADVGDTIREVLLDEQAADFMDEKRVDAIVQTTERRIGKLKEFAETYAGAVNPASTEDDVERNVAEDYTSVKNKRVQS